MCKAHLSLVIGEAALPRKLGLETAWEGLALLCVLVLESHKNEEVTMQAVTPHAVHRSEAAHWPLWLLPRFLGALAVLSVGAVHLQQYNYLYSSIPTIGTLFLLNFVGATAIGLGLLAPVERMLGRLGSAAVALLSLGGIGLSASAFVFLLVAERTPLFGFQEPGYDPTAIMAARVSEIVAVVALTVYLAARFGWRSAVGSW
jgi:hypothetical protein